MKLSVYSLQQILFQGEAVRLTCQTTLGEITVLNNHEAFIGVIEKGPLKVIDASNAEHKFEAQSGFVEVKPGNEVRCIVTI